MRWLLWLLGGILLGGIVHLATVLILPSTATRDAYSRLSALTPTNAFTTLDAPSPDVSPLPFSDPAFTIAVCRYDLAQGPMRLTAPVTGAYTALTFYDRRGIAYYAINDRAAGRKIFELDLMTAEQHENLPQDEEITAADRLIVEAPQNEGLVMLRALAPEPSDRAIIREAVSKARCETQAPSLP